MTRPNCHRSAMSTSTCLGATRSRCRRLPRAASCGYCEPQVNRDPADTYCRAAVDSRHRTSLFGCPDHASDHWLPTHSSRKRFSQRTTRLPWNLTFAHAAEIVGDGDTSRSRVLAGDRYKFGAERLHPIVTNWHCRPVADYRSLKSGVMTLRRLLVERLLKNGRTKDAATQRQL